jgi:flagellar motor switch protein FliN/FliY
MSISKTRIESASADESLLGTGGSGVPLPGLPDGLSGDAAEDGRRPSIGRVEFSPFPAAPAPSAKADIGVLLDVVLSLTVELGRTRMTVRDVLGLGPGVVIELDKLAGDPADVSINGIVIARGEVAVVDDKFGVRVTEITSPARRVATAI